MNWLIGLGATALIAGGCLLAYPGREGLRLTGLALVTAGLTIGLENGRSRK